MKTFVGLYIFASAVMILTLFDVKARLIADVSALRQAAVTPAPTPSTMIDVSEDADIKFVESHKDRNGTIFYKWKDSGGRAHDVYVQHDPKTGNPRLISYSARRIGGSEGPAEPPTDSTESTDSLKPQ